MTKQLHSEVGKRPIKGSKKPSFLSDNGIGSILNSEVGPSIAVMQHLFPSNGFSSPVAEWSLISSSCRQA
jgi:hypothetical protein